MTAPNWFWIVFTIFAATAQTGRNAMQRELTAALGAVGATHVRFLFGTPFAILFLIAVLAANHAALPHTGANFWLWIGAGALTQILGTALMLMTMEQRSFVVATAYIKTEPVFVALFGLMFLADPITLPMLAAILIATAGVIVISFSARADYADLHTALLGLGSGLAFAIAAIGFRGAILSLAMPGYVVPATFTLAVERMGDTIVLRGTDDGVGVEEAQLTRLFERFFRADRARASRGTGLGLAIVKHIVTQAGGTVEALGGLGAGLEVRCRFSSAK